MASQLEEYKAKLRSRNASQAGDTEPLQGKESEEEENQENTEEETEIGNENPKLVSKEIQVDLDFSVVNMDEFASENMSDKLNLLMAAINSINANFHLKCEALQREMKDKVDTLTPRVKLAEKTCNEVLAHVNDLEGSIPKVVELNTKIAILEKQNSQIVDELTVVKGILLVHDKNINTNKDKVVDLTARSMANNIVITGLKPLPSQQQEEGNKHTPPENCKELVIKFLQEKMKMTLHKGEVLVTHRIGQKNSRKPQPMVVRCGQELRDRIFKFTHHLKDQENEDGDAYYVNPQLPEPRATEKKEREEQLRQIKKANELIPDELKHTKTDAYIKGNVLYINKVPQKKHITPPTVQKMFNCDNDTQTRLENVEFAHTDAVNDKGNIFRGHAAHIKSSKDVNAAYIKLRLLYPECNHHIMAYVVKQHTGFHDAGEHSAGARIQKNITPKEHERHSCFCDQRI